MQSKIQKSHDAFEKYKNTSRGARSLLLQKIADGIKSKREELRNSLISEAKKPYLLADIEINRAITTFTLASEEARRFGGELIPLDTDIASKDYLPAVSQWFPRGPVLAITPYNFPLNLVAHKVAPALAVGASVIVKPPPQAPTASLILEQIFKEALKQIPEQIPAETLQVAQVSNDELAECFKDKRIAVLSFTGSDSVGWMLKEKASHKKVVLELGGNAAVIVHTDADLKRAAARCAFGGFAYAGQICISVQRVFVQKDIMPQFTELFIEEIKKIKVGDPSEPDTVVGPVIDSKSADKIMAMIDDAVKAGAKLLCGGKRSGNTIEPTVLMNVAADQKVFTEEAFGPVVIINTYNLFNEAIAAVNNSKFGLQAGVFTDSTRLIDKAFNELNTGGVIVNDTPNFRADHMPYGGTKDSGEGREGVRYAMEEFSERKTLVKWRNNL